MRSDIDKMADSIIESNIRKLAYARAHPNDLASVAGVLTPLKALVPHYEATIKNWEKWKRKRAKDIKKMAEFARK